MGCCLSTTTSSKTPKSNPDVFPPSRYHLPESDTNDRAPPPLEEETVKEVLSETPIPKPLIPTTLDDNNKSTRNQQQQPVVEQVKIEQPTAVIKPPEDIVVSEVSEVSEMYSFSESLSTVTEKRDDDDGEVTQRLHRSPALLPRKRLCSGDIAGGKERVVRSPSRRPEPSPAKRTNVAARSAHGRKTTAAVARRNVGPPNAVRRDAGEGSGRRSRSPVTMRGEIGARRPVRYKSPSLAPEGRQPAATAENGGERNEGVSPETTESLENPHVSLECFIFL